MRPGAPDMASGRAEPARAANASGQTPRELTEALEAVGGGLKFRSLVVLSGAYFAAATFMLAAPFLHTPFLHAHTHHAAETLMAVCMALAVAFTERIISLVGRRTSTLLAIAAGIAGALASALATDVPAFLAGRALVGAGAGASLLAASMYASEMYDNQVTVANTLNAAWAVGALSIATVASLCGDWRVIAAAGVSPALVIFALTARMEESVHWLLESERGAAKARLSLRRLAAVRNVTRPPELSHITQDVADAARASLVDGSGASNHPPIVCQANATARSLSATSITTILAIVSLTTGAMYFGLSLGIGKLSGSIHANAIFGALAELPAYVCAPVVLCVLGRRASAICGLVACSAAMVLCTSSLPAVVYTANFAGKFAVCTMYSSIYTLAAEALAPRARGTAFAAMRVTDAIGSVCATLTAALPNPFIVLAATSAATAAVACRLPETRAPEQRREPIKKQVGMAVGM